MVAKRKTVATLEVPLPPTFTVGSLYVIIGGLFNGLRTHPRKITIDFAHLKHIHVGGVATISNMIEFCRKFNIEVEFKNTASCAAMSFLTGAGFAALYFGQDPKTRKSNDEFLPLKLVEYNRSHSYLHGELVPWLARLMGLDIRALASLKVCFEEIFNNIKDHSTVDIGCSCAHFDPERNKIKICISDFGIGIPRKVRRKTEVETDQDALRLACQEGFTTKSTPRNRGAGLHVLIQNVVTRNSGSVIIYSGKGILSCLPGPTGSAIKMTGSPAPVGGLYPGTMIHITLDTKKFVPSAIDEEEFVWE